MNVPQFGQPEPGRDYPDRPAAFAVIERDGRIALVRVTFEAGGGRVDLPGGGIDPGETAAQAAIRECGEEAGLVATLDPEPFVRADHYFVNEKGGAFNTRGQFFAGRATGEEASLKTEDDHALEWRNPMEALTLLDREAHVWAVAAWLRFGRR